MKRAIPTPWATIRATALGYGTRVLQGRGWVLVACAIGPVALVMGGHGVAYPVLNDEEAATLKMSDALDGVLHCLRERELGNQTIAQVFINFVNYVEELKPTGRARQVLQYAKDRWFVLNGGTIKEV